MQRIPIPAHVLSAAAFFEQNYQEFRYVQHENSRKVSVPGADTCRYCDKKEPEVAFTDECHVLTHSIGNRRLFAEDECEKCNKFFGKTIEDDFGKWSLPYRVMSSVKGKDGYPTLKRDGWRIDATENGFEIQMFVNHEIAEVDEETKTTFLPLPRDAFTPINVYKAFVRMAMSMLPRTELDEFKDLLTWLQNPDPTVPFLNQCTKLLVSQYPVFPELNSVAAFVYRRKTSNKSMPNMIFVLAFANYAFQCFISAPKNTQNQADLEVIVHPFLTGPFNPPIIPETTLLNGTEKVRGEIVKFNIGAQNMTSKKLTWHENVAVRAYTLWEDEGCVHGCDQKHWFEAEQLLCQEAEQRRKAFFPDRSKDAKKGLP
jgi:hypothetical protein